MSAIKTTLLQREIPTASRPVANFGSSHPIGATVVAGGVNFSIFSRSASGMELLFFDGESDSRPARIVLKW